MDSRSPPHWTFAARAAYFGDRMCPFCDRRNPGDARFCNACASPLHLKPCKQCDAVNDEAATNCYKCGAAYPVPSSTPSAKPTLPAAESTPAPATTGDVATAASATQPRFAAAALPATWRLLRSGPFAAAVIATIVIVGAYQAYRMKVATPDTIGDASRPIVAADNNGTTAPPAAPPTGKSKPAEPEIPASLLAPIPMMNTETPKLTSLIQPPASVPATRRASAHRSRVPAATKRASAHQRPERKSPTGATASVARDGAAARGHSRAMQTSKALRPDRWHVMQVSLARCGGDLFARIACDQRVRRQFCEGHWGVAPECASGVVNEHGQ